MTIKNDLYLCGGIFFVLLLQVRKTRSQAHNKYTGETDGLADTDVFKGLIYVVTGQYSDPYAATFKKNVSQYKGCQYNGGAYIPFKEVSTVSGFDNDIKNNYPASLNRMIEFADKFIDEAPGKREWLVKALLDMIESDVEIKHTDELYIGSNGNPTSKTDICTGFSFEFQPFLLGVLHYIITHRQDNQKGQNTYSMLYPNRAEHVEGEFCSNIGDKIKRSITVVMSTPLSDSNGDASEVKETPEAEEQSKASSDTSNVKVINQYINNPTIVNQNGEKNIHIDHIDTLNI
jgi:hypothetical protein